MSLYPNGHVVEKKDRARIRCGGVHALAPCGRPAERCYYMQWSSRPGISFFYYCDRCWITEGPDGSSPRDRASAPGRCALRQVSPGGRVFYLRLDLEERRREESIGSGRDPGWTWEVLYEGQRAGLIFLSDKYGRAPEPMRWSGSLSGLRWGYGMSAPAGVGFDVDVFDTPEEVLRAWLHSADQILDWHEGREVWTLYGRVQRESRRA